MATNKVIYKGDVLIDITDSTVTADTLNEGIIAYGADGERVVGIGSGGGGGEYNTKIAYPAAIDPGFFGTSDSLLCSRLESIVTKNAITLYDECFEGFSALKYVDLPNVTSVGFNAFSGCNALTSIDLPKAINIGNNAFYNCNALTSIDLPNVTSIGISAFSDCNALTSIDLPNVISIGVSAFYNCNALTSIDLPNVTSIRNNAFDNCITLTSIDLPNVTSVESNAFSNCKKLITVILRSPTICNFIVTAVLNTMILTADGVPTGEGFIYVPSALFEDYVAQLKEQATQIVGDATTAEYMVRAVLRKIEDYPEICG